jgi:hypothetical protein
MKPILSNRQTIITSWVIAASRWVCIAGMLYFNSRAHEYIEPKSGRGDIEKAEPFLQASGVFFWVWVSLILLAIILALISPKIERSMVILFQVVVLPSLEFWFMFFMAFNI